MKLFDDLFDFNDDGILDAGEEALEYMIFQDIMDENDDEDEDADDIEDLLEI